ncbi:MAG TPA: hypothetical protein VMQ44_03475 [Candidatus Saccharimonadales bacterium]|nr:hypothetical protein [Candidatus Saccharimonadales bacterium]
MPHNQYQRRAYKSGRSSGIGPATAKFLLLALLAVFSLLYLVQSAQGSDMAIQLRSLDKQQQDLEQESSTLTVNASRLQSLDKLNQSATQAGLVPITPPTDSVTLPGNP